LEGIAADLFCALAARMAELETERDVNTSTLEAEKDALQRSMAATKQSADNRIAAAERQQRVAEDEVEHNEGVVERLISSLRSLPASCANSYCSNEFGSLTFERNGKGEWKIRCGARKCRCRLN
jgi:hypothetical protein